MPARPTHPATEPSPRATAPPCASGPEPATAAALSALRPELIRAARRLSWGLRADTGAEAEDLTQETLLALWMGMSAPKSTPGAKRPENLRAYAHATLRNRAAARARALARAAETHLDSNLTETLAIESAPGDAALDAELEDLLPDVLTALAALPPKQAEPMRLRALSGLSYAQIAARLGLPLGTVTSRLARGRARLAREVGLAPRAPLSQPRKQR